jgi:hypothetical protein
MNVVQEHGGAGVPLPCRPACGGHARRELSAADQSALVDLAIVLLSRSGCGTREIAAALRLAERSVRDRKTSIRARFGPGVFAAARGAGGAVACRVD